MNSDGFSSAGRARQVGVGMPGPKGDYTCEADGRIVGDTVEWARHLAPLTSAARRLTLQV
jgi:hypothetical protein